MTDYSGTESRLIYPCSGAADVGEIADKVARRLRADGFAKMTCLAGIGAALPKFVQMAKETDVNIAIDGCDIACAKKALENIGVVTLSYILTDMGLVKGESSVKENIIAEMCEKIKSSKGSKPVKEQNKLTNCSCSNK